VLDYVNGLFGAGGALAPHGYCLVFPELIWTHVASDAIIGLAYFSIPLALARFLSARKDMVFGWMVWLFAGFILLCGMTHFFSIWTVWHADYGLEAIVKALTAVFSIGVAFALWPLLPKALALPSPSMLAAANAALADRVAERDHAYQRLERETAERIRAEETLRHVQKMDAIGQLTGGIAHDFNNLMMVVSANIERANRFIARDPETAAKALGRAREGADRAAVLTGQLLAFARRTPLAPEVQPLGPILHRVVEMAQATARDIRIELNVEPALWPVKIDASQMEAAILNLIVNARDASPPGGRVALVARNRSGALEGSDAVELCIEDEGEGMSDEVRERAFEPFFTTKPVGKGTGLGLAQVYGFITQSGGDVRLTSAPGVGTTVSLLLPRAG
jgi:signal transduction histidine kinase